MMKRYLLYLFACLSLSAGLLACGENPAGNNGGDPLVCETSEDCSGGQACVNDACVNVSGDSCNTDLDCPNAFEYCGDGTCQVAACSEDADCAAGSICDTDNRCRTGCRTNDDCTEAGEVCNQVTFICEFNGCTPGDCLDHEVCDDSLETPECVPDGTCETDRQCNTYERWVDDGIDYTCQEGTCKERPPCETDDQCGEGRICVNGDCPAGCRTNDDCLLGEYCSDELKCVEGCNSDADCNSDEICVNKGDGERVCEVECTDRDECEIDGQICSGYCQYCTDDNQCYGAEFCDLDAEGTPDGKGLCAELPPECPADDFGDNHALEDAVEVTSFPYEHTATSGANGEDGRPLFCRQNSAGEWFKLTADPGKIIVAEIEYDNSLGNLDVALVDSTGSDLVQSARPPTNPGSDNGLERVEYAVNEARSGTLDAYVQVRGTALQPNLPYRITIDVRDPEACDPDDSFEDNDTPATAKPLPVGTTHRDLVVCGDDASEGDDPDFYELDVQANQIVTVTLQAPHRLGDVDIYLYKQGETTSVAQSRTVTNSEQLHYSVVDAGIYVLEVSHKNGVGKATYDVEWTSIDDDCNDTAETNDDCPTATPVSDGTSYSGNNSLNICSDDDWYKIALNPLDQLTVTATFDPANAAGELQMTLFGRDKEHPFANACGNFLMSATEQTVSGSTERELVINYTAELGGEFYILASRFSGIRVPYELDFAVQPGPACDDDSYDENGSNNDDSANAVTIDPAQVVNNGPDSAIVGRKVCDANQDWYSITIDDQKTLTWEVAHDAGEGQIDATLIDSDGTTPVTDGNGDPITLDANQQVSVTNNSGAAKTYYLRVEGAGGIPVRNDYWLLTSIDGSGTADPACPDIYENNDDAANATELAAGTHSGLMICGQDGGGDWYRTMVEAGQTITVEATFDAPSATPGLSLYEEADLNSAAVFGTNTSGDTYAASYTSAKDQYIYYRINTSSSVAGDPYELNIQLPQAPGCNDDGFDGNHDSSTAEVVDMPGLYTRLMACNDEADWYAVNASNGELIEAYINYDSDMADLDVAIFAPSDLSNPAQTGDDTASVTPSTTGTYYVRVASADPTVSVRLAYDLLLYRDSDLSGTIDPDEGPADRDCPDAYENNDTRNTAAEVPAGSYTNLRMCSGNPINDDDYYSVYVPAGATVTTTVDFDSNEGNIDLILYNDAGQQVDWSQQSGVDTETVTATNNSSLGQDYKVRVFGGNDSFESYYSMVVDLAFSDTCTEDSYSGNVDMANAQALSAGAYELNLCEGTEDWFSVDLANGETLEANVEVRTRLGDVDVELQAADGSVLAESATADNVEQLVYTNNTGATQTVYLRAYPKDNAFMRNAYDLWLAVGSNVPSTPFCPDSYERNDTTVSAATLDILNESQFTGMIACGAEEDWYSVDLSPGTTYEVDLFFDHTADADLALALVDANGNAVADDAGNDIVFTSHSSDDDESTTFSVSSSGTYFLGVKNHNAGQADYHLSFAPQTASCPEDQYEFNDNVSSAWTIGPDLPIQLALGACSDDDYFKWVAPMTGQVDVTLFLDNTEAHFGMRVEEYSTTTIWKDEGISTPTDDNRVEVSFPATAGETYIIQINRATLQGQSTPTNGGYFLVVE